MKRILAAAIILASSVVLAKSERAWTFDFRPFKGRHVIYGGGLADPFAPTTQSKNIAISVKGPVAQQMFDSMGPDITDYCGVESGTRFRQRAELVCSADPKNGYECNFGFDLIMGRSIGGSVC